MIRIRGQQFTDDVITLKDTPSKMNRLGPRWIPPVKKNYVLAHL